MCNQLMSLSTTPGADADWECISKAFSWAIRACSHLSIYSESGSEDGDAKRGAGVGGAGGVDSGDGVGGAGDVARELVGD